MTKMTVLYAVFVAFMAVVLVRRHTRVEEESGRAELLGATGVGADAPLLRRPRGDRPRLRRRGGARGPGADIASGLPVAGSVLFGASWLGIGLVGTGDLRSWPRRCRPAPARSAAIAAGAIAVLFLVRAVGDTTVGWLCWL